MKYVNMGFWVILRSVCTHFVPGRCLKYATVKTVNLASQGIFLKEINMFKEFFTGTIVDGNSGQDGLEYVALAAIILVILVVVGRMIAQKLQEGGEAATDW